LQEVAAARTITVAVAALEVSYQEVVLQLLLAQT
jgi:hypothetical protein